MGTTNKHRLFHKWNIILFIFTAIFIEICTFIFNGIGFLPKYFFIDLAAILFFAVILMLITNNIANICVSTFILFIQVVISFANANLLLITGEVFAWDMLSVLNEAARAAGKGIGFSIGYFFIAGPILAAYILLIIKLLRYWTKGEEKPKRDLQKTKKHAVITCVIALVSTILFTSQKANIETIAASEDTVLNDKYLYDTFYSHQEGFKKFGTFGYYLVSGIREINNNLISKNSHTKNLKRDLDIYFHKNKNKDNKNDLTGISKDNNVILILWETGDFSGINKELTPNLYRLMKESLVLNEYYGKDQTNISEGKFLFGSYPSEGFLNYNYLDNNYKYSLPNIFRQEYGKDSQVVSFHNNIGTYYKRNQSHVHFGFDEHVDMADMKIKKNPDFWINRDSEMFKKASTESELDIPLIVPTNTDKFFSYVATFSTHGPFEDRLNKESVSTEYYNHYAQLKTKLDAYLEKTNPTNYLGYKLLLDEDTPKTFKENALDLDEDFNKHAKEYLLGAMDFDLGIGYLMDALERENKLDDTTIVLVSDHYAYYHEYTYGSKGFSKEEGILNPQSYHIPGLIFDRKLVKAVKNMDEATKQKYNISYTAFDGDNDGIENDANDDLILGSDKFFCNTDVTPTLLNLLGIEYDSALYVGNDLFNKEESLINTRKGGIFNNRFYSEDGYEILNLNKDYLNYKENENVEFTEEQIIQIQKYEDDIKAFIKQASDFIVKTNYLNMIYECDYFSNRLLP